MKTTLKLATVLMLGVLAACGGTDTNPNTLKPVKVTVSPATVSVDQNGTATFAATVANSNNTGVTWSVKEANGGTIDQSGHYTAPASAGTFTVVATAKADGKTQGTAKVSVSSLDVAISPTSGAVATGQTLSFTATVTGTNDTGVDWSVLENGGGTIDASGVYTAPSIAGTFHVRATSKADPRKHATAEISVTAIGVAVSPVDPTLNQGQQQQFTATVANAPSNSVTWSVDEASGGTIDQTGLYTPPAASGFFHVRATSTDDPTKSGVTSVHVLRVEVAISGAPASAIDEGASVDLTATVTGAVNTGVTWSASAGTIDTSGHFVAPIASGPVTVTATSVQDPTAKTSVVIDVNPVQVAISGAPATVDQGDSFTPTATVTHASTTTVTWSASAGTIDPSTGAFTAPFAAGPITITATSTQDSAASASVTVNVNAVNVAVSGPASLDQGASGTFTATVTGTKATGVTWSASAGTIDPSTGAFTAPNAAGPVTITATSTQNASDKGTATVTVNSVSIVIAPSNPTLTAAQTVTFTATVTGTTNTTVTWSADRGPMNATSGDYTAPTLPGSYTVTATSASDGTQATTTVTVPTAAGLSYADPTGTGWRLVKNTTLSTATHLVLDLVGPSGQSGTGVALTASADPSLTFTPVQAGDTELAENVGYQLGSAPVLLKGVVSNGNLKVGVFQKGTTQAAVPYGAPLVSIAVDYTGAGQASGLPLNLSVVKATELTAGGAAPDAITVAVGQLSAQ